MMAVGCTAGRFKVPATLPPSGRRLVLVVATALALMSSRMKSRLPASRWTWRLWTRHISSLFIEFIHIPLLCMTSTMYADFTLCSDGLVLFPVRTVLPVIPTVVMTSLRGALDRGIERQFLTVLTVARDVIRLLMRLFTLLYIMVIRLPGSLKRAS